MADLIMDGHYLLHRVMRASTEVRMLATSRGKPTGGAFSFLKSLRATLWEFREVDRAIVVFDSGRSARRRSLYPEYKANRKPRTELDADGISYIDKLNTQVRILKFLLPRLAVRVVDLPGKEGDDLMALIPRLLNSVLTYVATDDKDLLQLVSPSIHVWRPMAKELVTVDSFMMYARCTREVFVLKKAIVGDPSDNIIGVKNVGEKTASSLLESCRVVGEYPFSEFFEYLLEVNTNRSLAIISSLSKVLLNYELMDLSREEFSSQEQLKIKSMCTDPVKTDVPAVKRVIESLEYFSLVEDLPKWIVRFQMLR